MDNPAFARAVELVEALTNPAQNLSATDTSNALIDLQLSPSGWAIGDQLLQSNKSSLRFYGAITFQIKLNRQSQSLSSEDATYIQSRLLEALFYCAQTDTPAFVLKKLCGCLATFFIKTPDAWNNALAHVICRLAQVLDLAQGIDPVVQSFSDQQKLVAFQFAASLAEDVATEQGDTPHHKQLEDSMKTNGPALIALLQSMFHDSDINLDTADAALTCYASWCAYGHRRWRYDATAKAYLTNAADCVFPALMLLSPVSSLALSTFTIILDNCPDALLLNHKQILWQYVSQRLPSYVFSTRYTDLITPDEDELAMLKLIPALGEAMVIQIYDAPSDDTSRMICGILQRLALASGYPGEEDDLITPIYSFWSAFAEHVTADDDLEKGQCALDSLMGAIRFFIEVLRPAAQKAFRDGTWIEDDYWSQSVEEFYQLMTETSMLRGDRLASYVNTNLIQAVNDKNWKDIDFGLSAVLAACEGSDNDSSLQQIFGSSLLVMVTDPTSGMPLATAKTIIRFVENYQTFFQKYTNILSATLEQILIIQKHFARSLPDLSDHAAKCVAALGSGLRRELIPNLGPFSQACLAAMDPSTSSLYQREKVAFALSCVIEALPAEHQKLRPMQTLLDSVQAEITTSDRLLHEGSLETGEQTGVAALRILAAIAKGCERQTGESSGGDDATEGSLVEASTPGGREHVLAQVWQSEIGRQVQQLIMTCLAHISRLRHSGDAIEATCTILRAGLKETVPGAFVFPASTYADFLQMLDLSTPRVEALLTTACTFVSASLHLPNTSNDDDETHGHDQETQLTRVFHAVAKVVAQQHDPRSDPQVAQLCTEFLDRLAMYHIDIFFSPSPDDLSRLLGFVLTCLNGDAPMLKRASTEFFQTLLDQTKVSRVRHSMPDERSLAHVEAVMSQLAPHLATVLMNQIAGQAQRSELEFLTRVLKQFVLSRPSAKGLLEQAMQEGGGVVVRDDVVSAADKRAFVAKIAMLRGGAQTGAVVKEFWAACKGTVTKF